MLTMKINRREFLGLSGSTTIALGALSPTALRDDVPEEERLGRVLTDNLELKLRPDPDSETLATLPQDTVVSWLRETVGPPPQYQAVWRWLETADGFLYSPQVQPVHNHPMSPLTTLPDENGMWVEVTVPFVEMTLHNPPARSPWVRSVVERGLLPRLYYSQVIWVDQIKDDPEHGILYRLNEPYGTYGDIFWAPGHAFQPLTEQEVSPIRPEVEDKRIVVNNSLQTLSCFEGNTEVFFCTVSTGVPFGPLGEPLDRSSTPLGPHPIWRKLISLHMSGGTTGGGWDLAGVAWTTLFVGNGIAIHSTFWHNNFGVPMSRGCVNTRPDDARWIFRWTLPVVPYNPGDVTVGMPGGTRVEVVA
jgi:hypothetical protein